MKKTILVSKQSKWWPSTASRSFHRNRSEAYPPKAFQNYTDWYYFSHIDSFVRTFHALGMLLGFFFLVIAVFKFYIFGPSFSSFCFLLTVPFFFAGLPLFSHWFYEGKTEEFRLQQFISTLVSIMHITFMTVTGTYDLWLRKFIKTYPFTLEAWALEEKEIWRFTY